LEPFREVVGGGYGNGISLFVEEETLEAENATMAGGTNQTTSGNTTGLEFLSMHNRVRYLKSMILPTH
jgi:hypothetical protein